MVNFDDFSDAIKLGESEALSWLTINIPKTNQYELVDPQNIRCGCGGCARKNQSIFFDAYSRYGEKPLKKAIRDGLLSTPQLEPAALEATWIYPAWLKGRRAAGLIWAFLPNEEPASEIIEQLNLGVRRKFEESSSFISSVKCSERVVKTLDEYFKLPDSTIDIYRRYAGKASIDWVYHKTNLIEEEIENTAPEIDLNLPFDIRWRKYLEAGKYKFIHSYFTISSDRYCLQEEIIKQPDATKIIDSIKVKKVSWKRLKKRLLASGNFQ